MGGIHTEYAKNFKAFADASRLMILENLRTGELCGNALLERVAIAQSTLSHHMKTLVEAGIVEARREGKMTFYAIDKTGIKTAVSYLQSATETDVRLT
jgi:ArsR family transcriptional regulator